MTIITPGMQEAGLLARLAGLGYKEVTLDNLEAIASEHPHTLVMLSDDPVKYPEVMDNVVIVPEVLKALPEGSFFPVYANLAESKAIAKKYGVIKFPALVFLRGTDYVGLIGGLMDWPDIVHAFASKLKATTQRPPSVGIPVVTEQKGC